MRKSEDEKWLSFLTNGETEARRRAMTSQGHRDLQQLPCEPPAQHVLHIMLRQDTQYLPLILSY